MSIAKDLDPTQLDSDLAWSASAWDGVESLPNDLSSDEPPLETDGHLRQMILLIQSLECLWRDRQDFYATGNLTIYYSPEQIKARDFRRYQPIQANAQGYLWSQELELIWVFINPNCDFSRLKGNSFRFQRKL